MSKNVLSIDFTYFQKATIEALRSYPEDIDKETYLSTLLWACHYLDAVQGVLTRSVSIMGEEFMRLERILQAQPKDCPVLIANSQVHVYNFIHAHIPTNHHINLYNLDMYHDLLDGKTVLNCRNWVMRVFSEYRMNFHWVANPRLMAADIVQYDYLRQEKGETKKSCHVDLDASVYGGNGSVKYEILECSNEISYSKSAFGLNCILDTEKTGTYTLKAKVTDTEDASITTILSVTIIVKDSVAFKGCVYDLDGHKITSTVADVAAPYYISLYAKEKDTLCDASEFNDPKSDGSFQIFVSDGTYDVFVASEAQDIGTWVCDSKVTASTPYQKIVLPRQYIKGCRTGCDDRGRQQGSCIQLS